MTAAAAAAAGSFAPEERPFPLPLRLRLRRRVLSLDYRACSRLLCRLLTRMGYEDVRPAGRTRLLGYNRPGGGGWDLTAALPAGVGSRRVIVRLKHSGEGAEPVHQRCADELRGACLRAGASEALLVTTGDFSLTARRQAVSDLAFPSGVAPVRLVDGEELVEMMLTHRVGVRGLFRSALGGGRLEMDEKFFDDLAAPAAPPARPARPGRMTRPERPAPWRVTIRVIPPRVIPPGDGEEVRRRGRGRR